MAYVQLPPLAGQPHPPSSVPTPRGPVVAYPPKAVAGPRPSKPKGLHRRTVKLAELQSDMVNAEMMALQRELERIRQAHVDNQASMSAQAERRRQREEKKRTREILEKKLVDSAVRIQRCYRGHRVRKFVIDGKFSFSEWASSSVDYCLEKDLESRRNMLDHALHELRGLVHDLNFKDDSRERAALVLQSWWRGLLTRRIIVVEHIWKQMNSMYRRCWMACTYIQSVYRGFSARRVMRLIHDQNRELAMQLENSRIEAMGKNATKIQGAMRNFLAAREATNRRSQRGQNLDDIDRKASAGSEKKKKGQTRLPALNEDGLAAGRRGPSKRSPKR